LKNAAWSLSRPFVAVLALSLSAVTTAASLPEPLPQWVFDVELGFVASRGNTETETSILKLNGERDARRWRFGFSLDTLHAADNDETSAERYLLSAQLDYKLEAGRYLFAVVDYENDRFSGYDHQSTFSGGYGWPALQRDDLLWNLEAGLGLRQNRLDDGTEENDLIIRLGSGLKWQISDVSDLQHDLSMEIGKDTTITKSVAGLKSQVADALAMKLTLTVKHSSSVPVDSENTDIETAATLVYSF